MPTLSQTFRMALVALLFFLALPLRAQTTPAPLQEFGIAGLPTHSLFGWSVAGMSDLNEDGLEEFAIGVPGVNTASGGVLILSGTFDDGAEVASPNPQNSGQFGYALDRVRRPGLGGVVVLAIGAPGEAAQDALGAGRTYLLTQGLTLSPIESPNVEPGGSFGSAVAGAGDTQGDGVAGLLVGAPGESPGNVSEAGRAYLYTFTGDPLTLEPPDPSPDGHFGWAVAGLGDITNDGAGEVIVGAPGEEYQGIPGGGEAYVFWGGDGALLGSLASPNPEADGAFGFAVAGAGDVNGAGVPDLLIGAPGEDGGRGRAYLFSGETGEHIATLTSPTAASQNFGWAVSGVPDLDGDGHADLLVGAPYDTADQQGRAYVFSGATQALLARLDSGNGEDEGAFGWAVGVVGDLTGDGRADLLVGAPAEDPGAEADNVGRVYLYGSNEAVPVAAEPAPGLPGAFALGAAYPNPFNPTTTVPFTLAEAGPVRLAVYDVLGREVAVLVDEVRAAGAHTAVLDAADLPSGAYLVRLTAGGAVQTRRVTLLR